MRRYAFGTSAYVLDTIAIQPGQPKVPVGILSRPVLLSALNEIDGSATEMTCAALMRTAEEGRDLQSQLADSVHFLSLERSFTEIMLTEIEGQHQLDLTEIDTSTDGLYKFTSLETSEFVFIISHNKQLEIYSEVALDIIGRTDVEKLSVLSKGQINYSAKLARHASLNIFSDHIHIQLPRRTVHLLDCRLFAMQEMTISEGIINCNTWTAKAGHLDCRAWLDCKSRASHIAETIKLHYQNTALEQLDIIGLTVSIMDVAHCHSAGKIQLIAVEAECRGTLSTPSLVIRAVDISISGRLFASVSSLILAENECTNTGSCLLVFNGKVVNYAEWWYQFEGRLVHSPDLVISGKEIYSPLEPLTDLEHTGLTWPSSLTKNSPQRAASKLPQFISVALAKAELPVVDGATRPTEQASLLFSSNGRVDLHGILLTKEVGIQAIAKGYMHINACIWQIQTDERLGLVNALQAGEIELSNQARFAGHLSMKAKADIRLAGQCIVDEQIVIDAQQFSLMPRANLQAGSLAATTKTFRTKRQSTLRVDKNAVVKAGKAILAGQTTVDSLHIDANHFIVMCGQLRVKQAQLTAPMVISCGTVNARESYMIQSYFTVCTNYVRAGRFSNETLLNLSMPFLNAFPKFSKKPAAFIVANLMLSTLGIVVPTTQLVISSAQLLAYTGMRVKSCYQLFKAIAKQYQQTKKEPTTANTIRTVALVKQFFANIVIMGMMGYSTRDCVDGLQKQFSATHPQFQHPEFWHEVEAISANVTQYLAAMFSNNTTNAVVNIHSGVDLSCFSAQYSGLDIDGSVSANVAGMHYAAVDFDRGIHGSIAPSSSTSLRADVIGSDFQAFGKHSIRSLDVVLEHALQGKYDRVAVNARTVHCTEDTVLTHGSVTATHVDAKDHQLDCSQGALTAKVIDAKAMRVDNAALTVDTLHLTAGDKAADPPLVASQSRLDIGLITGGNQLKFESDTGHIGEIRQEIVKASPAKPLPKADEHERSQQGEKTEPATKIKPTEPVDSKESAHKVDAAAHKPVKAAIQLPKVASVTMSACQLDIDHLQNTQRLTANNTKSAIGEIKTEGGAITSTRSDLAIGKMHGVTHGQFTATKGSVGELHLKQGDSFAFDAAQMHLGHTTVDKGAQLGARCSDLKFTSLENKGETVADDSVVHVRSLTNTGTLNTDHSEIDAAEIHNTGTGHLRNTLVKTEAEAKLDGLEQTHVHQTKTDASADNAAVHKAAANEARSETAGKSQAPEFEYHSRFTPEIRADGIYYVNERATIQLYDVNNSRVPVFYVAKLIEVNGHQTAYTDLHYAANIVRFSSTCELVGGGSIDAVAGQRIEVSGDAKVVANQALHLRGKKEGVFAIATVSFTTSVRQWTERSYCGLVETDYTSRITTPHVHQPTLASLNQSVSLTSDQGDVLTNGANILAHGRIYCTARDGTVDLNDIQARTVTETVSHGTLLNLIPIPIHHGTDRHSAVTSMPSVLYSQDNIVVDAKQTNAHGADFYTTDGDVIINSERCVDLSRPVLAHDDSSVSLGVALVSIAGIAVEPVLDHDYSRVFSQPLVEDVATLGFSSGGFGKVAASANLGMSALELMHSATTALQSNKLNTGSALSLLATGQMQFKLSAHISLDYVNSRSSYETLGQGGIHAKNITIHTQDLRQSDGFGMVAENKLTVKAHSWTLDGAALHASSQENKLGLDLFVGPRIDGGAHAQHNTSESVRHVNTVASGKTVDVDVDELKMHSANITGDHLQGRVGHAEVVTQLNHAASSQVGGSFDTTGNVGANYAQAQADTVGEKSGFYFKSSNCDVGILNSVAGHTGPVHAEYETRTALQEKSDSVGVSVGGNMSGIASAVSGGSSAGHSGLFAPAKAHYEQTTMSATHDGEGHVTVTERSDINVTSRLPIVTKTGREFFDPTKEGVPVSPHVAAALSPLDAMQPVVDDNAGVGPSAAAAVLDDSYLAEAQLDADYIGALPLPFDLPTQPSTQSFNLLDLLAPNAYGAIAPISTGFKQYSADQTIVGSSLLGLDSWDIFDLTYDPFLAPEPNLGESSALNVELPDLQSNKLVPLFTLQQPDAGTWQANTAIFGIDLKNTEPSTFLYRGTSTAPDIVFKRGFLARGDDFDIFAHVNSVGEHSSKVSGFVSTSTDKEVAISFPRSDPRQSFVYEINPKRSGVDVSKTLYQATNDGRLDFENRDIMLEEREVVIPRLVQPTDIRGFWPVKVETIVEESYFGEEEVTYYKTLQADQYARNPEYVAPGEGFLKGLRWFGRTGNIIGAGLDGADLYNAYQFSRTTGNYNVVYHEGARVAGGWSGAAAGGMTGAEICLAATPLVAAGCAIAGSVAGYVGGGWLGAATYDVAGPTSDTSDNEIMKNYFLSTLFAKGILMIDITGEQLKHTDDVLSQPTGLSKKITPPKHINTIPPGAHRYMLMPPPPDAHVDMVSANAGKVRMSS